jgi:integrase
MPVQGYVTDEELHGVLSVIDTTTEAGKRDRAMILIAATTGLRACDLIRLKLTDVDWEKAEIKLVQQKTSRTVYCPLLWEAGEALQDYILNARPKTECPEIFLRTVAPKAAISTAAAVGFMFKTYQTKAGICRHPFDGKGFHGLRRRLAKKLLVAGTPLTTIMQILGHNDMKAVRQYLSLDTSNLMECALDFRDIPVEREALL